MIRALHLKGLFTNLSLGLPQAPGVLAKYGVLKIDGVVEC